MKTRKTLFVMLVTTMILAVSISAAALDIIWTIRIGGTADESSYAIDQTHDGGFRYDKAGEVKQTRDDGFIIVGTHEDSTSRDMWLLKTDVVGNLMWHTVFGEYNKEEYGRTVDERIDGGFIITATQFQQYPRDHDIYVVSTDEIGRKQSDILIGSSSSEHVEDADLTSDGGLIIAGHIYDSPQLQHDVFLAKLV